MTFARPKPARFAWRALRNLIYMLPGGTRLLFPPDRLALRFGRGDADYALKVWRHHLSIIEHIGEGKPRRILEIGPGRNLGTALLWWSLCDDNANITLWDVYANAEPSRLEFWAQTARALLDAQTELGEAQRARLVAVADGEQLPAIRYLVCSIEKLAALAGDGGFDLVYSHAMLEHVRNVRETWGILSRLTAPGGWHSHRIDLADHGARNTNYIEMLEWSDFAWWLTTRYIPGAINRARADDFLRAAEAAGFCIREARREMCPALPVPRNWLAAKYRDLPETELRTTALDMAVQKLDGARL